MEVAGMVIGAISLASLFEACFKAYDKITALGRYDIDLEDASIKLQIEQQILTDTKRKLDGIPLQDQVEALAPIILTRIETLLEEIQRSIVKTAQTNNSSTSEVYPFDPNPTQQGMKKYMPTRSLRKIKWVAGDKALLDERFSQLHYFTDAILTLATSEAERAGEAYLLRHIAIVSRNEVQLTELSLACHSEHSDIAQVARVKQLLIQPAARSNQTPQGAITSWQHGIPVEKIDWADSGGLSHAVCKEWAPATLEGKSWTASLQKKETASTLPVLVEWRGPFISQSRTSPIQSRLDNLCRLLRTMHESNTTEGMVSNLPSTPTSSTQNKKNKSVDFGMLECLGWTCTSSSFERIGLVFRYPVTHSRPPLSLKEIVLENRRKTSPFVPDLGKRFDLAFKITSAVTNILAVGWVHRAIRSSNVMLFDTNKNDMRQTYLVGLAYAREEDASKEFSNMLDQPEHRFYRPPPRPVQRFGSSESGDGGFSSDDEKIAGKLTTPTALDDRQEQLRPIAIDMFGLGVVLLEIGLWQTAERLAKATRSADAADFLSHLVWDCVSRLLPRCGKIYHDVVQQCLKPEVWGSDGVEMKLAGLLKNLKECKA